MFPDSEVLPVSIDTRWVVLQEKISRGQLGTQQEQLGAKIPRQRASGKSSRFPKLWTESEFQPFTHSFHPLRLPCPALTPHSCEARVSSSSPSTWFPKLITIPFAHAIPTASQRALSQHVSRKPSSPTLGLLESYITHLHWLLSPPWVHSAFSQQHLPLENTMTVKHWMLNCLYVAVS